MKTTLLTASIFSSVLLGACEITYAPDVGNLQASSTDAGETGVDAAIEPDAAPMVTPTGKCFDSNTAVSVSFATNIRPLLIRCQPCHGATTTSGLSVGTYESLRRGGVNSGTRIIIPGKPCDSIIVQKLGLAPPFGARMPYSGNGYFTAAELTTMRDWIAEGALNN